MSFFATCAVLSGEGESRVRAGEEQGECRVNMRERADEGGMVGWRWEWMGGGRGMGDLLVHRHHYT